MLEEMRSTEILHQAESILFMLLRVTRIRNRIAWLSGAAWALDELVETTDNTTARILIRAAWEEIKRLAQRGETSSNADKDSGERLAIDCLVQAASLIAFSKHESKEGLPQGVEELKILEVREHHSNYPTTSPAYPTVSVEP